MCISGRHLICTLRSTHRRQGNSQALLVIYYGLGISAPSFSMKVSRPTSRQIGNADALLVTQEGACISAVSFNMEAFPYTATERKRPHPTGYLVGCGHFRSVVEYESVSPHFDGKERTTPYWLADRVWAFWRRRLIWKFFDAHSAGKEMPAPYRLPNMVWAFARRRLIWKCVEPRVVGKKMP